MKSCGKCKEVLPLSSFNKRSLAKDGHQSYCKSCNSSYLKEFNPTYAPVRRNGDQRKTGSRLYGIWYGMLDRCNNPENTHYSSYGGRGIAVCTEWHNWADFKRDMLDSYSIGKTIERIDVNGGYNKENCTWIDLQEQSLNRQDSLYITTPCGEKILFAKHCKEIGFSICTAYERYKRFGDNYLKVFEEYKARIWSHGDEVKRLVAENPTLPAKELSVKIEEETGQVIQTAFIRQLRSDWKVGRPSSPMLKLFGSHKEFYLIKIS